MICHFKLVSLLITVFWGIEALLICKAFIVEVVKREKGIWEPFSVREIIKGCIL